MNCIPKKGWKRTSLAAASVDMDNPTAGKLLKTHKVEMGAVCGILQKTQEV